MVKQGKLLAEWDGTNDVTLPDGSKIKASDLPNDALWAMNAAKALFQSGSAYGSVKQLFKQAGLAWDETKQSWVYQEGAKKGEAVGANDRFALDLTSYFEQGRLFGITKGWLEQGAKGVDPRELAGSSPEAFFLLNKARIENELVAQAVYDEKGNIDYKQTIDSWGRYTGSLTRNAEVAGTLLKVVTLGFADSTPGTSYLQRNAELVAAYSEFLANAQLQDVKKGINQYYGPVKLENGEYPNGYPYHVGLDIDMTKGERILAGFSGVVSSAGFDEKYGNTMTAEHMFRLENTLINAWFSTRSAHMSSLSVSSGMNIDYSDQVGLAGRTGHSTGTHNHWEIYQPARYPINLFFTQGLRMPYSTFNSQYQVSNVLRYDPRNVYNYWLRFK
jgi:murein DD-endopeptidase MepM/ murein hydrolase activator NlpD